MAAQPSPALDGLSSISAKLIGQFATSIAPIYYTFVLGMALSFTDVLKPDFIPGISVIVQYVALPALMFLRLSQTPTSQLNLQILYADALSKLIPLVVLFIWWRFFSNLGKVKSIEWVVTFWMLSTLPNTVLIGDQILMPMFHPPGVTETWTTTIVFAQNLYWYNCVILMMELREMFIEEEKKDVIGELDIPPELSGELTEMEKQQKMYAFEDMEKSRPSSAWESNRPSVWEPNRLNGWEAFMTSVDKSRPSWELGRASWSKAPLDSDINDYSIGSMTPLTMTPRSLATPSRIMAPGMTPRNGLTPSRVTVSHLDRYHSIHSMTPSKLNRDDSICSMTPSNLDRDYSTNSIRSKGLKQEFDPENGQTAVHPARPNLGIRLKKILLKVLKRMLQVPILYGSVLGFVWSINEWSLPTFMKTSLVYCAQISIALAMILVGQVCVKNIYGAKGWVPCGWKLLWIGFGLRFILGPLVMWLCSIAVSMKGTVLKYSILQVIVPQGAMTFAFAQIYNCKLSVITPAVYIQMIVFVPIILVYAVALQKLAV